MCKISINEPELQYIELFRVALSEGTDELRQQAILNVKYEVLAKRLEVLGTVNGQHWTEDPLNAELTQWMSKTLPEIQAAAIDFVETGRRYKQRNERKLNVAEHIGRLIWHSIQDGKLEGVQTVTGILAQVRDKARECGINGAKDKDTLRKIWNTYRGVVHLGMAIDFCEEFADPRPNVLIVAEQIQRTLSQTGPKGRSKPYVDAGEQLSFVYLSKLWGPRYQDRGLTYDVG